MDKYIFSIRTAGSCRSLVLIVFFLFLLGGAVDASTLCEETCQYSNDSECDDGGPFSDDD